MSNPLLLAVVVQVAALLAVVAVLRKAGAVLGFLVSVSLAWLVALELISAHVAAAAHLLWVVPLVWAGASVALRKRIRKKHEGLHAQ
jgi:hypothetical protein